MGVDGPVWRSYGVWRHVGRIGHIVPDRELTLFANTEAEYTAAIFDTPVDHPLEAKLDQICKAT
jgi:hypothetical protein